MRINCQFWHCFSVLITLFYLLCSMPTASTNSVFSAKSINSEVRACMVYHTYRDSKFEFKYVKCSYYYQLHIISVNVYLNSYSRIHCWISKTIPWRRVPPIIRVIYLFSRKFCLRKRYTTKTDGFWMDSFFFDFKFKALFFNYTLAKGPYIARISSCSWANIYNV